MSDPVGWDEYKAYLRRCHEANRLATIVASTEGVDRSEDLRVVNAFDMPDDDEGRRSVDARIRAAAPDKCAWCHGSGRVGPSADEYVCPCPAGRERERRENETRR